MRSRVPTLLAILLPLLALAPAEPVQPGEVWAELGDEDAARAAFDRAAGAAR